MTIVKKKDDPFKDLFELQEKMHRLLLDVFLHADEAEGAAGNWSPVMDVYETGDAIVVVAEVPGLTREDIDIKIDQGNLVLQGERKFGKDVKEENYHRIERHVGRFSRSIALPPSVNTDAVEAKLRNGILEVTLPKTNQTGDDATDVQIS